MRTRLLLAGSLLVVALAAVLVLAQDSPRRSGTNNVSPGGEVLRLAPGRQACQPEDLPPSTRLVQVWVQGASESNPPALAVHVQGTRGADVRGRTGRATAGGAVQAELTRSPRPGSSLLCLRNRGTMPLSVLGPASADPADAQRLLRRSQPIGTIAVDRDVAPFSIVAGTPAKPIGERRQPQTYELGYRPNWL